jgi:PAS domain-containing protein
MPKLGDHLHLFVDRRRLHPRRSGDPTRVVETLRDMTGQKRARDGL